MNHSLRIAVADDEPLMLKYYERILGKMGHQVVVQAGDGSGLLEGCRRELPDLVVTDIRMPGLDGIAVAEQLWQEAPVPVILVSAYHDPHTIQRAQMVHVLAYLVKPIKQADLETTIAIAVRQHRELKSVQQETDTPQQALQVRKLLERAKEILMKRGGLDEDAAFQRLQKLARDRNQQLAHVARTILEAEEAFLPP